MPTLNAYANGDGYYILARPSDSGNITYQLKRRGEQIVEKVGYEDEDQIGWRVINALKVPDLVYTGDEGATDDDTTIDLSTEEIDALSEEDAKELLDELSSVPRIGDSQLDNIEQILGIEDHSNINFESYATQIMESIRREGVVEKSRNANISDSTTTAHLGVAYEDRDGELRLDGTSIDFEIECGIDIFDESQQTGGGWSRINILLNRDRGVVEYRSRVTLEPGNNGSMIDYERFVSEILSAIISRIEETQLSQYTDN